MKKYAIIYVLGLSLLLTGCKGETTIHKYNIENYKIETVSETNGIGGVIGTIQQITIFYYDENNILQHHTYDLDNEDLVIKKIDNLKNNYITIKENSFSGNTEEIYLNK